jgi:hypothetical protein
MTLPARLGMSVSGLKLMEDIASVGCVRVVLRNGRVFGILRYCCLGLCTAGLSNQILWHFGSCSSCVEVAGWLALLDFGILSLVLYGHLVGG